MLGLFTNNKTLQRWRNLRIKRLSKQYPEIFRIKGKKVLDVGCGELAPLTKYLSKLSARVWAGDIFINIVQLARKNAPKAKISQFPAENLPFRNDYFDFVYLLDVLEHVKNPQLALVETKRVAKKEGLIFIEISPYWAYPTGHHLYVIGFPYGLFPFQLLPKAWTKKIVLNRKMNIFKSKQQCYHDFINLNRLSIGQLKNIINLLNFKIIKEGYFINLPNSEIKINFIRFFPVIKEIFTMNYSCILKKVND